MMPLARKPSKASFPRAIQAAVRHAKARLQVRRDWAASTSRLGCKHVEARLQARPMGKRSFSHPQNGARCTSQRSTLHRPSQHAAPPIAPPCVFPPNADGQAGLLPHSFPTTAYALGQQVMRKWQQAVARPRKKFYLCPYRTLQTEKDR